LGGDELEENEKNGETQEIRKCTDGCHVDALRVIKNAFT
jgi:hypothetical protein